MIEVFDGLSIVELLIIIPSIPKARLLKAISLACSSLISGAILIRIGFETKFSLFFSNFMK